jgi:hypothetical protein
VEKRQVRLIKILNLVLLSALLILLPTVAACSSLPRNLRDNERLWKNQGLSNYDFTLERQCFCPEDWRGPVTIQVRNGTAVSIKYVSGEAVTEDKFSSFSIQNQATTFYKLSEITGNYLVDNSAYPNALIIKFNNPLRSMSFAFATLDYHGVGEADIPTSIKITAYGDSGMTQPVGTVDTKGVYITDATFPQGKLIFEYAGNQSFRAVKIELIPQTKGTTYFLVDDITVKPALP